jgi:hypothetical protein
MVTAGTLELGFVGFILFVLEMLCLFLVDAWKGIYESICQLNDVFVFLGRSELSLLCGREELSN